MAANRQPLAAGPAAIRVSTAIGVRTDEARQATGLTPPELRVLRLTREAVAMGDLAQLLAVPKSTVTSTVDQLVARGLVARTADEQDRRRQLVTATAQGTDTLAQFDAALASRVADLAAELTPHQRARLAELLRRVGTR